MSRIEIQWLDDEHDCETCGWNIATGAVVKIDGTVALDMTPVSRCYDGESYTDQQVYSAILTHLGHTVEETR